MRRFAACLTGRLRRPVVRVLVARIISASPGCSSFAARSCLKSLPPLTSVLLLPALDNKLVGALVVPRFFAKRRERPGRLRMIALDAPFATAMRMIHGVHGYTANRGTDAAPARAPGLSKAFILVVEVAHLANRGHTVHGKLADFARRQFHEGNFALLAQQLRGTASRTDHLPAATGIELQVVHHGPRRNVLELQRIAGKNVRAFARGNRGADLQPDGVNDVALLASGVVQQRQVRAAVRVVLDGRHFRGHADFVATKVHLAVLLLMTAAAMPDHHLALVVAPAGTLFRLEEGFLGLLLGDVALVHDGDKPPRCRVWINALESHRCFLPSKSLFFPCVSALQVLRVLDHLLALGELHVSLLPITPIAFV